MFVTIHTRPEIAEDLARTVPRLKDTTKLRSLIGQHGLSLSPLHPDSADRELRMHFSVSVPTEKMGDELATLLRSSGLVEAAYLKPVAAAPG